MMFAENLEQGDGNKDLHTKEMSPKIVGFRKKWSRFLFVLLKQIYTLKSLNKMTNHLSLLMESDLESDTHKNCVYILYTKIVQDVYN